jgi:hypothetical protein
MPETSFTSFGRDTFIVAGELYPNHDVQQTVAAALGRGGPAVPVHARIRISLISHKPHHRRFSRKKNQITAYSRRLRHHHRTNRAVAASI